MKEKKDIFQEIYEDFTLYNFNSCFERQKQDFLDNFFTELRNSFYDLNNDTILNLSPLDTKILRTRYGLYNNGVWPTLKSIAEEYNKTSSTICEIINKAKRMLSKYLDSFLKKYEEELYDKVLVKDIFNSKLIPNSIYNPDMTVREFLDINMINIFKKCSKEERNTLFNYIHSLNFNFKDDDFIQILELVYEKLNGDFGLLNIDELGLYFRTCNCLKNANISTLQDILNLSKTQLFKIKGLKVEECEEIIKMISYFGLNLKENEKESIDSITEQEMLKRQLIAEKQDLLEIESQIEYLKRKKIQKEQKIIELLNKSQLIKSKKSY